MNFLAKGIQKLSSGQTDRQTHRQTDTQTDRQTDTHTDRQTDTHTDRQAVNQKVQSMKKIKQILTLSSTMFGRT